MRILCVGDVCGSIGCAFLMRILPEIKRKYGIDVCIVNGENSADGNGITSASADSLFASGADVITGGNHTLRRKEIFDRLDSEDFLLRPHNLPSASPGKGFTVLDLGYTSVGVINLSGRVYMPDADNPFECADRIISDFTNDNIRIIAVDFHAEATSEKRALASWCDGRISFLFGTHTHVATADEQILAKGTGFITDIGMTGPDNSVLGVKTELSIAKIKDNAPVKFEVADGECRLDGCIFEVDKTTGKTVSIERISVK